MQFKKSKKTDKDNNTKNKNEGVVKSIFIAYSILLSHLILLAVLGILVLFFRGVINYMTWIFIGGAALILGSAYYFIKKLKQEKNTIREILQLPEFSNKDVEIRLLGGAASFKVGNKQIQAHDAIPYAPETLQLENPVSSRIQNLGELSRLLENNMITQAEYQKLKKEVLKNYDTSSEDDFLNIETVVTDISEFSETKHEDKNE